jgi:hypothetical protein
MYWRGFERTKTMRLLTGTAFLVAALLSASAGAMAGDKSCVSPAYKSPDPSIRVIDKPGPVILRPGDRLVLINNAEVTTVEMGGTEGRGDRARVTIKDCIGRAGSQNINVTGKLDVGEWIIDGNRGWVSFEAIGDTWVLL